MGLYLGKEKISNVASVITQNADSMATEIQNHIANSDIHITAEERTKWNAAADKSTEGSTEVSLPVDVEILETICENIEFTKTNNTYTFPAAITIDSDGLYYISYQRYKDTYDADNSGYLFSKPKTIDGVLSVRWLSNDINNSITMTSTKIVDTWVGSSGKSIVSIYKVNIITNDEMKKAALLQEGCKNIASGDYSHAEGLNNTASGYYSHAEGYNNTASGDESHAEGYNNTASGDYSHAEGRVNTASGLSSHAEGYNNTASGEYSHAEGTYNEASGYATHVQGKYNIIQSAGQSSLGKYCHIVGNGTSDTARSNAHTLDWNGNAWFAGDVYTGGTAMDSGAKKLATEVPVSTADNGKVLSVVNGAWAAAAMSSGAYVGSYVGNGASSKTLTFNFKPGIIIMLTTGDYSYMYVSVRGCNKIDRIGGGFGGGIDQGDITWNNTSIVLTSNDYCSISDNNCTYYYAVIPAMN